MLFDLDLKERLIKNYKYGYVNCDPNGTRIRKVLEVSTRGEITDRSELEDIIDRIEDEIDMCVRDYVCIDLLIKTPSWSLRKELSTIFFADITKKEVGDAWENRKRGIKR